MTVGENLRKAATRAMMLEETAKIVLYCKQFGGTRQRCCPTNGSSAWRRWRILSEQNDLSET